MTVNEARMQLVNVTTPEAAEGRLVLALAYAMDDLEKAVREEGPRVPLEDSPLPK
jgi:phage baseplate assembly protein W